MMLMIYYMYMHIQKQDQTEDLLKASRVDVLLEDMVKGFLNASLFFCTRRFLFSSYYLFVMFHDEDLPYFCSLFESLKEKHSFTVSIFSSFHFIMEACWHINTSVIYLCFLFSVLALSIFGGIRGWS